MIEIATTAPERADDFGTETVELLPYAHRGQQLRLVRVHPQHLQWQTMRYRSGLWLALTRDEVDEWAALGLVDRVG